MRSWATPEDALTLGYAADNDVWPVGLLEGAPSFARFADAAVANMRPVDNGSSDALTVLLLLAQSIELTLKAFLRPRGYNQEKLRREIGHDLPKALRAAVAVRFPQPHPSDEKVPQLLDDTSRGRRRLRYRVASALKLPLSRPSSGARGALPDRGASRTDIPQRGSA